MVFSVTEKGHHMTLTFSALQIKLDTYANSVDPDEMAHNEPSHQDQHRLPFCFDFGDGNVIMKSLYNETNSASDSNPGPQDPKRGALTTWPPGRSVENIRKVFIWITITYMSI